MNRVLQCLRVLVERVDAWVVQFVLDRERNRLVALSRAKGVCAAISEQGYLCTLDDPHVIHQALTEEGNVICEWVDSADRV